MSGVTDFIANAQLDALNERADDSMETAHFNVYEFLVSVVQQSWSLPTENDIKQIQYIHKAAWDDGIITSTEDIQSVCLNAYGEFPKKALNGEPLYDEAQLRLHKKMWDLIVRDKQGLPKANDFINYCRRANASREAWDGNCYNAFALDLLTTYLTPEQHAQPKYAINYNYINDRQQSWVNTMVRKNLGNINVARYIWEHGIPNIMTLPPHVKVLTKETLKQMIEQLMTWHASILYSIVEYEKDPGMEIAHRTSALEETEWRSIHRNEKQEARAHMERGRELHMDEQSRKRRFGEMSVAEQQILQDFRTGKAAKRYHHVQRPRPRQFQGKVLYMPRY